MATHPLIQAHLQFLQQHNNPGRAAKEKAYLYSDLDHYGVSFPAQQSYFKSIKSQLTLLTKPQALRLVRYLWSQPSFEQKVFALHILNLQADQLTPKDLPLIEKLMRQSQGWALLDGLIIPLMPHLLQTYPQTYSILHTWIQDPDFWIRRSALLAQLLFFRRGQGGDKQLFFDLAASQLDESWIDQTYPDPLTRKRAKFFIRKAIGWTLREMSTTDPKSVVTYVNQHRHHLSGLSYREATRKLSTAHAKRLLPRNHST